MVACSWSRQGANTLPAEWERRLGPYVAAWAQADQVGHVWREERPFDASFFRLYLQWYVPRTRVFLVRRAEQEDIPQPVAPTGTYSLHSVEERHAAVSVSTCTKILSFTTCLHTFYVLQGLSLAQIEWDMVHMVGRLDLGRPPTRDALLSVGEVARTARQRLGFAHVSDLLPRGCHPDFQQPASSGQPGPSTQQYPAPPPYMQPGGSAWSTWAGTQATQPGWSTWATSSGPPPYTQPGGSTWQHSSGPPPYTQPGGSAWATSSGPPPYTQPGGSTWQHPAPPPYTQPGGSSSQFAGQVPPPRAEAVPGQAGTPRDLLPRFQVN